MRRNLKAEIKEECCTWAQSKVLAYQGCIYIQDFLTKAWCWVQFVASLTSITNKDNPSYPQRQTNFM